MSRYSRKYFVSTIWKEGRWFFVIPGLVIIYDIVNAILFSASFTALDIFILILAVFIIGYTIFFLRPPKNFPPVGDNNKIYASADGYIFSIEENVECPYMPGETYHKVIIFMHVASMHWNLSPIRGKIEHAQFVKGKFQNAFNAEKNWQENEHQVIIIEDELTHQKVMVAMVAGLIARRIRFFKKEGDSLEQGDILGLIRYGSANVLYFPTSYKIQVRLKEKSRAGKTIIAQKGSEHV